MKNKFGLPPIFAYVGLVGRWSASDDGTNADMATGAGVVSDNPAAMCSIADFDFGAITRWTQAIVNGYSAHGGGITEACTGNDPVSPESCSGNDPVLNNSRPDGTELCIGKDPTSGTGSNDAPELCNSHDPLAAGTLPDRGAVVMVAQGCVTNWALLSATLDGYLNNPAMIGISDAFAIHHPDSYLPYSIVTSAQTQHIGVPLGNVHRSAKF